VNSDPGTWWRIGLLTLLLGAALETWERRLAAPVTPEAAAATASVEAWFETAGTWRPLLADGFWLQANLAWERRAETEVRWLTRLAVAAEPQTPYFRVNAARMLAYDFPSWRVAREPHAPEAVKQAWRQRAADEAIAFLLGASPEEISAELWVEAGGIALYGKGDPREAAALYQRAARMDGAPWTAGRISARLLLETGQHAAALAWLEEWLPRLPADDPEAGRDWAVERIAELKGLRARTEPF
jgi:tetratricopeptide (TPR) repeat protein